MAQRFQQQAQLRKLICALLILVLFTLSLLHRKFIIEPKAFDLQLRESARGEVEVAATAWRHALVGSRGIVVTALWWTANKKQMKHEWNELEILVNTINKLQPYFIRPWRF